MNKLDVKYYLKKFNRLKCILVYDCFKVCEVLMLVEINILL